ncbi:MAG TPA: penicillin-binding protein 2 [Candidatus Saccharimonadales bacterium]
MIIRDKIKLNLPRLRIIPGRRQKLAVQSTAWQEQMLPGPTETSVYEDGSKRTVPIFLVGLVVMTGLILGWRLFQLQVTAFSQYNELANGNRVRETINYAPRGSIYDRDGRLLAQNIISHKLIVTPYLLPDEEAERSKSYELLARLLKMKPAKVRTIAEAEGTDYPLPINIKSNLDHKTAITLGQFLPKLNGFQINEFPIRQYRAGSGLAHILGYTGDVSEADLAADGTRLLLPIDIIGKTGIELQYDQVLRGQNGFERTEVDTLGRPIRLLAQSRYQPGQDITLTLDLNVQRRLAKELKTQMRRANVTRASAVAVDPETGEIIAMVSLPDYDNNLFARGISSRDFSRLVNNPDQPLVNKAIAGGYTTGSTIKPVVASAALQEKVVTPQTIIVDSGALTVRSVYDPSATFTFLGWRPGGLGPMNIRSAIAWSSNIYFYTVGGGFGNIGGLGVDRLTKYYRDFGLGERSGIDLPGEISGLVPDRAWKQRVYQEDWFVGDTYNISIGQGDMLVSPLQLTLADMAVANGGYLLKPQILLKIGEEVMARRTVRREVSVSKSNIQIVREGMRQVLTGGTTCECTFAKVPFKVAGKSGTAQTTSNEARRPHAWFTAFAPYEQPQVMITAMLEGGSGGSLYAAPVIAGAMETFFRP